MKDNNSLSEMLHALADGQLDSRQREEVLALLENNAELRGEMCDIYRIKDLVQTVYPLDDVKQKPLSYLSSHFSPHHISFARVASYLLAFILTLGAGYTLSESNMLNINKASEHIESNGIILTNKNIQENKVIVFLSSSEPGKFTKALSKAESLAKSFPDPDSKVYVVTSASGIDLLRLKTSPHQQQIKQLGELYPSLHFVACNNTLFQFKKAGKPIELIETAEVAPSAVEFIVKHLQQGWRYIAI